MTKAEYMETKAGQDLINIALMLNELNDPIEKLLNDNYTNDLKDYENRLKSYQNELKDLFGTDYDFIKGYDYSEEYHYYGLYSFKTKDWLYKRITEYIIN